MRKIGSNHRYRGRVVGLVDEATIAKAKAAGIENIAGGCINKTHEHVLIYVRGLFPGAHASGYALRSRVVWWLHTGEVIIGREIDVHHDNEDKIDDRLDNLKRLDHPVHSRLHNPKTVEMVERSCGTCGGSFKIEKWRLRDKSRGQFCSQGCYQLREQKKIRVAVSCQECGKSYEVIPSRLDKTKFCSYECAGQSNARNRWG
jgi:hypothetical protein